MNKKTMVLMVVAFSFAPMALAVVPVQPKVGEMQWSKLPAVSIGCNLSADKLVELPKGDKKTTDLPATTAAAAR